jgi:hypothetical protein
MSENITSNNLYTSKSRKEDDVKSRVSEKCLPTFLERLYGLKVTCYFYVLAFFELMNNFILLLGLSVVVALK